MSSSAQLKLTALRNLAQSLTQKPKPTPQQPGLSATTFKQNFEETQGEPSSSIPTKFALVKIFSRHSIVKNNNKTMLTPGMFRLHT